MDTASCFHIYVSGQLELAKYPLGPDGSEIFCKYEIVVGPDWEFISGLRNGITQSSVARNKGDESIVFNMPIEFSAKSTSPFGWPQIVCSIFGKKFLVSETILGYCRLHVPMFGSCNKRIVAPILIPRYTHFISELSSWITGINPELKNPQILAEGAKNKGLLTESYGELIFNLQTICRGTSRMGYDWGQNDG